jgi:hypothetical protein
MNPIAEREAPASPLKSVAATFVIGLGGTAAAVALFLVAVRFMRERHLGAGWYGAAILGAAYAASRAGQRLSGVTPTPAAGRYRRRFLVAMTAYVFTLLVAESLYIALHPAPWLAWPLALAPSIPIIATIVVMGLYLREETDELERAIASEAALWATGGLLAIATTWGFLEQFGLVIHVEAWAAFPVWAICLGPATAIVRRRYQ